MSVIVNDTLALVIETERETTAYRLVPIHENAWKFIKGDGIEYLVSVDRGVPSCSCPQYCNRRVNCKHLVVAMKYRLLPLEQHGHPSQEEA